MNPLNHFGIHNKMIRGDTKSYNNAKTRTCPRHGKEFYYAGQWEYDKPGKRGDRTTIGICEDD